MKLCVECKHHKVSKWDTEITCHHPVFNGSPCPVTGYVPQGTNCGNERSKGIFFHHLFKRCGPSGKLWEPIPPKDDTQPLILNEDAFLNDGFVWGGTGKVETSVVSLNGGSGGSGTATVIPEEDKQ